MLTRFLARRALTVYALLRILSGVLIALHGAQKFGVLSTRTPPFGSQLWVGGVIELACGILVAIGKFTTIAAFILSGTMAVAYVQFHWKLQLGRALLPTQNQGELALIYSVWFLYVACQGPGPFSLDGARDRG
jgi:putative oxidoreductase